MNGDFWRGRRVLVTGHTGFKAGWLSLWLARLGAEVCGYGRERPSDPSVYDLARVAELISAVSGDICDARRLREVLAARRPEIVVHLAAQPLVRRAYADPRGTFRTNVLGTVCLLDAVRQCGSVRVVVNVTSDAVYEDQGWAWPYRESDRLGGADPYTASKACSELVTASYRASLLPGVAVASARAGNVFGGGDFAADRLIPDAMRAAAVGSPLKLRNPTAVRPWQHVLSALAGYLQLAERLWDDPSAGGAWNFGPSDDDMLPVGWIAQRISELWEGVRWTAGGDHGQPRETEQVRVDSSKARGSLGWSPRWDLADGLRRTVEWHRALAAGDDMRTVTLGQIADYETGG